MSDKMVRLDKKQSKALYARIQSYCDAKGYSPYSFGYAAGVSHNYVYRLKDARSDRYNAEAINKIMKALDVKSTEEPAKPVKQKGLTSADKFDALPEQDREKINLLVAVLYDRQMLRKRVDLIVNSL